MGSLSAKGTVTPRLRTASHLWPWPDGAFGHMMLLGPVGTKQSFRLLRGKAREMLVIAAVATR